MDSSSPFVRNCYRKFCIWGRRTPINYSEPYEGGPTPLFKSPQKLFYTVFFSINLLVFLIMIATYIV